MNIYAFHITAKQDKGNDKYEHGNDIKIAVADNIKKAQAIVEKEIYDIGNIERGSFEVVRYAVMSMTELGKALKPQLEDMVKEADAQETIRELIDKI